MTLLIQSTTEAAPSWLSLFLYLIPAAAALIIVVAAVRRRRRKGGAEGER